MQVTIVTTSGNDQTNDDNRRAQSWQCLAERKLNPSRFCVMESFAAAVEFLCESVCGPGGADCQHHQPTPRAALSPRSHSAPDALSTAVCSRADRLVRWFVCPSNLLILLPANLPIDMHIAGSCNSRHHKNDKFWGPRYR